MKGNNKRRYSKGRKARPEDEKRRNSRTDDKRYSDKVDASNDISWYSRNPNLLVAAGSFPYPYRPGSTLKLGNFWVPEGSTNPASERSLLIPGVLSMKWTPSIGVSNAATDPASIAAKEIYTRVRQVYAGSLDADAPDFMVYLLALDSIFSYIAWLKRLYRTLNAWSPNNYAMPDKVLYGMGLSDVTIQALRIDKTNLWQCINQLVLQSRKFTCPATMDIFNRHYWMSDNVYTDANTIQSQFYLFDLYAVYKYAELPVDASGNTAAGLTYAITPCHGVGGSFNATNVADLYNFGKGLIDALVAWDDAYTINGYLMRAYEGDRQFVVAELAQDEVLAPVYEEEVLMQIENSRTLPAAWSLLRTRDLSGFNVTQNPSTNAIISNPSYTVSTLALDFANELTREGYTIPPMLSVRSDSPTVADSVVASRLQASVQATLASNVYTVKVSCGTEVPWAWVYVTTPAKDGDITQVSVIPQTPVFTATDTNVGTKIATTFGMEQFDWHPFTWLTVEVNNTSTTPPTSISTLYVCGDTHNLTAINNVDLENLHKVCLYSEFNSFSL